jgi:hypothetical protein
MDNSRSERVASNECTAVKNPSNAADRCSSSVVGAAVERIGARTTATYAARHSRTHAASSPSRVRVIRCSSSVASLGRFGVRRPQRRHRCHFATLRLVAAFLVVRAAFLQSAHQSAEFDIAV